MKKFILCLLLAISMIACGPTRRTITNDDITNTLNTEYSTKMYLTMDRVLGISQVDSMIRVDNLDDLDKWHKSATRNEDRRAITTYMFIKSLEENDMLIYTAIQYDRDTLYKCTKKVTSEIK